MKFLLLKKWTLFIVCFFFFFTFYLFVPYSGPTRWWWKPGTGTTAHATAVSSFFFPHTRTTQSPFRDVLLLEIVLMWEAPEASRTCAGRLPQYERLTSCIFILGKVLDWFIFKRLECDANSQHPLSLKGQNSQHCKNAHIIRNRFLFSYKRREKQHAKHFPSTALAKRLALASWHQLIPIS